jgi:predicted nuclease with TOPRIM domain
LRFFSQDDSRHQNQIQKLKSAWYTEQEMLVRELEENKASVVAERIEMLTRIRAFEAERSVLHEELARLKQRLADSEHRALQGDARQQQARAHPSR